MTEIKTVKKTKTIMQEPKKWNVIFHNDDKTPMDFVIAVLQEVFKYSAETAYDLTMKIHHGTSQVVASYIYEIAEQKTSETLLIVKNFGYPLKVELLPDS